MLVAHDREGHVILAVAGDEDARFEREIDEAFQNAWREAAVMVGAGAHLLQVGFGLEHGLAVAVVTAGTGFEHSRIVDLIKCRFKFLDAVDSLPRRGGRAMVVDEPLLVDTVLRDAQQIGALRGRREGTHLIDASASTFSNS